MATDRVSGTRSDPVVGVECILEVGPGFPGLMFPVLDSGVTLLLKALWSPGD